MAAGDAGGWLVGCEMQQLEGGKQALVAAHSVVLDALADAAGEGGKQLLAQQTLGRAD